MQSVGRKPTAFEAVCESCVHFATGPEFALVILRQRDHADQRHHTRLAAVYNQLLDRIDTTNNTPAEYAGETIT